jgi:protein-tyrosine phosphatase/membrane-associated phospholipid phosphatase
MGDIHGVGGPPRRVGIWKSATTAVLLSVLFVVVYGSTNWFTSRRPASDIGTWYFGWELTAVPYVPLLIVPYMSIDLFFFMASFLCRDERELRTFARRVAFSILVAAAFFLVLPLKLAWPVRPAVDGWFGAFVEQSCSAPFLMEYPHNLFPTLHIALCLIVGDVYVRHTRGIVRTLLIVWFSLIAASTVLTWQHHLVDVLGGFVLAAFAFHLFREEAPRLAVVPNVRLGWMCVVSAVIFLSLVPILWPWGVFLLWPAAGLVIVAGGYFGWGPGVFRKSDGRLPLSARFSLAPFLCVQHLSLIYYRRQCRAWDEVVRGVHIGRTLSNAEATAAIENGVTAVLDLTAEFSEAAPFRAVKYLNLPILDLTVPTLDQLKEAVAFITRESAQGTVYVHCKIGYSRSAAIVGAYLLASGEAQTAEEAVFRLRKVRPPIVIRPEAMEALRAFARSNEPEA